MTTKTTTTRKPKAPEKLQANPFMFEVFDLVVKQRSNAKKVEILQEYKDDSLMAVLIWNFDPSLESALPPGEVPFADAKEIGAIGSDKTFTEGLNKQLNSNLPIDTFNNKNHTTIRREYERFYLFIKGGDPTLPNIQREKIFINLLYGLHPKEAEIICLVKDKKLQEKYNISFDVVKEAFPEIVWGDRIKQ
jgi:hypothetical protein